MNAPAEGDAVSQLVQFHAKRAGLVNIPWTGKGNDDLGMLVARHSAQVLLAQSLWSGMKELWEMPEMQTLPDPVAAKIYSIILKARALFELKLGRRNDAAAKLPPTPPGSGIAA